MERLRAPLRFCLLALFSSTPATAHNTAVAVPVVNITVDGDFADWPQDAPRHDIQLIEYGQAPTGRRDLTASFRVGYNADRNWLYVAVEVEDESLFIDSTSNVFWNTIDGCELYIDTGHGGADLPVQYLVYGTRVSASLQQSSSAVEVRWQHGDGTHRYEWRVDLGPARNRSIGLDGVVTDKDEGDSFSRVTWGEGIAKITDRERLGGHSLGVADGLPGNWVRAFLQDERGYLWIGTEAGLSRFDGRYLFNVGRAQGLVADEVRCLVADSTGALWVGTDGGLSRLDGTLITNFTTADGLPSNQIRGLAIDGSGRLWIATDAGLARYDGWEFRSFSTRDGLPGNQVRSVIVDRHGDVWMGIWGRGLCRFDGTGFTSFTTRDGLNNNQVRPVLEDREGHIWFGTEAGVSRCDGEVFTRFTAADGLAAGQVWALHEDRSGKIWVGTVDGDLSLHDGTNFVNYTVRDGLASDVVLGFGEDRDGMLGGTDLFNIHVTNPDESIFASIAWNLWTDGRLGTDLLSGAIPGIEHHVYWTPPLYYIVLAGWLGLWGLSLLSVRALPMVLAVAVLGLLYYEGRLHRTRAAWLASAILLCDLFFDYAGSIGRMDMLAIVLTTAAIILVGVPERKRRHIVAAGTFAAGALLTHPLGAAAGVAVMATIAIRDRRSLPLLLAGALPPLLLWILYICQDPGSFTSQMGLQLARKAGTPHSPVYNASRFLGFYGAWWPAAALLWIGGAVGLFLERERKLPWFAAAACLWPVVLFFGEIIYPAYLAPAGAVGLASLAARINWGPRLVVVVVLARLAPVALDPPPAGGIDPGYPAYCEWIEQYLGRDHDVILGLLPDPWFGLRHREDLRFHHAPPVVIDEIRLHAYVYEADVTIIGGYNPPGFVSVMDNWELIGSNGQKLWVMEDIGMVDYDYVLALKRQAKSQDSGVP